jgi:hypothetical protein
LAHDKSSFDCRTGLCRSGAQETARRSIRDANRAADIISRLRALFAKEQVRIDPVDLNDASREVISLALRELESSQVILRSEFAEDLPLEIS